MLKCPCFSGKDYSSCCGLYHAGEKAPTALATMRSRYSAYALCLADYIILTTHPKSPYFEANREAWIGDILKFSHQTKFIGLEILAYGEDWVHFEAKMIQADGSLTLNEQSRFKKMSDRWLYLSGIVK